MSILEMLYVGALAGIIVIIFKVIQGRRNARKRGEMAKEEITAARKYVVEDLNRCIQHGEIIGTSEIKAIIKSVKKYHPDVQIDFDLTMGQFEIELVCFNEKRIINGFSCVPKYELVNNLIYRIN